MMRLAYRCSLWAAVIAAAGLAPSAFAQNIVVDGDLTDLKMFAQADQSDRPFDVTDAFVSGWDFTHVWLYYNPKVDTLYVGIELQPNGDVPGVPGDADGDSNPNESSRLDVPQDQFGVGTDEAYIIAFDTNLDGDFEGEIDMLFEYRANTTRLLRPTGGTFPALMTTEIAVGVAGATTAPGMPFENPDTDAIEIAIRNFSFAFANGDPLADPCDFGITVYAGSLVDSLQEDELDSPLLYTFPEDVTFEARILASDGSNRCTVAEVGDVFTVRSTITNTTTQFLTPIWINHHIPDGLEVVPGSLTGATQGKIARIGTGFLFRHLRPGGDMGLDGGETETVEYQVRVVSLGEEPLVIRAYGEGVLSTDSRKCIFSCIDVLCVRAANQ